ncbi:MAG TPA: hypothetical protein VN914_21435, partial [Polyangia bacterium]|nr:hypothetical protein [Polyangia bacterium]
ARAQSDTARAEDLIRQANALRQKGQDPAALPLYREAYDVARSPRTAAQLALVELALGYWVSSDDHFTEALVPAGNSWIDRNRKVLQESQATARSHIGALIIEGKPPGAEVRVNATRVGNLPLSGPIRVGEGTVTVEVKAAGHEGVARTLSVHGTGTERLWLELAAVKKEATEPKPEPVVRPAPVQDIPPPRPAEGLPTWRRVLPWALAGGAIVGAGVGVWQHIAWRNTQEKFEAIRTCAAGQMHRGSDERCEPLYNTLIGQRNRAYVSYGVAGALGIGAAVTFILNSSSDSTERAFGPGPTALGLSYGGRF